MTSLAFVTHPSVRIKGTENAYSPTQCMDELCPVKAPHLHCPFCVKTDAYQDPVILKAHYRVKHVDKGIDFAGLKILRCCDQCEIVGIIKGEKRFKGAHWHCYRCRNGFNRRDEAIKHYKTHFRNPQTTFQIQITQDLNSPPILKSTPDEHASSNQDTFPSIENPVQELIHPALSHTVNLGVGEQNLLNASAGTNRDVKVHKVKVKHEPIEKEIGSAEHDDQQTIMIIQGDQLESAFASHILNSGELSVLNKSTVDSSLSWEIRYRMEEEEKNIYKAKAQEYKAQVELLQQQLSDLEAQLTQQMSLRLDELISSLSTDTDTNKQALGLELAKVVEQFQSVTHSGTQSLTVSISGQQPELDLQGPNQVVESSHLDSSAVTTSVNPSSIMSHLSEIPQGYHVITATPEGHLVVGKTSDYSDKVVLSANSLISKSREATSGEELDPGGDNLTQHSVTNTRTSQESIVAQTIQDSSMPQAIQASIPHGIQNSMSQNIQDSIHQDIQDSMHQNIQNSLAQGIQDTISQGIQDTMSQGIQDSLPQRMQDPMPQGIQDSIPASSSLLNGGLQQNEVISSLGSEAGLLHVVTAADGLASLGTDLAVVTSTGSSAENTFVMEIGDGHRVLVQSKDTLEVPIQTSGEEPPDKKMRTG